MLTDGQVEPKIRTKISARIDVIIAEFQSVSLFLILQNLFLAYKNTQLISQFTSPYRSRSTALALKSVVTRLVVNLEKILKFADFAMFLNWLKIDLVPETYDARAKPAPILELDHFS